MNSNLDKALNVARKSVAALLSSLSGKHQYFEGGLSAELVGLRAERLIPALASEKQAWALVAWLNRVTVGAFGRAFCQELMLLEETMTPSEYEHRMSVVIDLDKKANEHFGKVSGQHAVFARDAYRQLLKVRDEYRNWRLQKAEKVSQAVEVFEGLVRRLEALGYVIPEWEATQSRVYTAHERMDSSIVWDTIEVLNRLALDFLLQQHIPHQQKWLEVNMLPGEWSRFEAFVGRKVAKAQSEGVKLGTRVLAAFDAVDEMAFEIARAEKRVAKKETLAQRQARQRSSQLARAAHCQAMKGRASGKK